MGLEDTLRQLSGIDIGSELSSSYSNPVAAVPSLHAGWAVAVAYGVWRFTKHSLARLLAVLYPVAATLTTSSPVTTSFSTRSRALPSWRSASL